MNLKSRICQKNSKCWLYKSFKKKFEKIDILYRQLFNSCKSYLLGLVNALCTSFPTQYSIRYALCLRKQKLYVDMPNISSMCLQCDV